jgi:hypothetical protein
MCALYSPSTTDLCSRRSPLSPYLLEKSDRGNSIDTIVFAAMIERISGFFKASASAPSGRLHLKVGFLRSDSQSRQGRIHLLLHESSVNFYYCPGPSSCFVFPSSRRKTNSSRYDKAEFDFNGPRGNFARPMSSFVSPISCIRSSSTYIFSSLPSSPHYPASHLCRVESLAGAALFATNNHTISSLPHSTIEPL